MDLGLKHKVAVLTGKVGGIGEASTRILINEGGGRSG